MPIVTFTSDFGTSDHYVAAVKARLLSLHPTLSLIDISHDIEPFNIAHMAYVIRSVYENFPEGTIHIIGANEVTNDGNTCLIAPIDSQFFIAPDNGLLSLISEKGIGPVYQVTRKPPVPFPTIELSVPAASELLQGKKPGDIGTVTRDYKQLMLRQPKVTRQEIAGHVIRVDHYGNLITNIKKEDFDRLSQQRKYTVRFGKERADRIHQHHQETEPGDVFFIFNSLDLLEIGIYQGNAAMLLGLNFDSPIHIQFEG